MKSGGRSSFGLFTGPVSEAHGGPRKASGPMLAVFEPGTPRDAIFAALTSTEARIVRPSAIGLIWIVAGDEPDLAGRLTEAKAANFTTQ